MSIRTEVKEVSVQFANLAEAIASNDADKASKIIAAVLGIVKEVSDFAKIPQNERIKGAAHAMILAGSSAIDKLIKYSDEPVLPA
jgi:hypothetical protein